MGVRLPKIPFRATLSGRRGISSQQVEVIGKSSTHFQIRALTGETIEGLIDRQTGAPTTEATWVQRELVDFRPAFKALPRRTRPSGHQLNATIHPFANTMTWTCKHCDWVEEKGFGPGHSVDWFPAPKACPASPGLV